MRKMYFFNVLLRKSVYKTKFQKQANKMALVNSHNHEFMCDFHCDNNGDESDSLKPMDGFAFESMTKDAIQYNCDEAELLHRDFGMRSVDWFNNYDDFLAPNSIMKFVIVFNSINYPEYQNVHARVQKIIGLINLDGAFSIDMDTSEVKKLTNAARRLLNVHHIGKSNGES